MKNLLNLGPVRFALMIAVFLFLDSLVTADDVRLQELESAQGVAWLQPCREKALGVEILCNKNWKQDIGKDSIIFTVSEDPAVLLTVARSKEVYTGLNELTRDRLEKKGQYVNNFELKEVTVGGKPALQVQGFSQGFTDIRLMDFYVYHDTKIYSFLFSVSPAEDWGRFLVMFDQMVKSIEFMEAKI